MVLGGHEFLRSLPADRKEELYQMVGEDGDVCLRSIECRKTHITVDIHECVRRVAHMGYIQFFEGIDEMSKAKPERPVKGGVLSAHSQVTCEGWLQFI